MRRRTNTLVVVLTLATAGATHLNAQTTPPLSAPPATPGTPRAVNVDTALARKQQEAAAVDSAQAQLTARFAIPEIPATTLLGVAPAMITRPATPKDLTSSLIDGIGSDGRMRQGLAIEASMGLLKQFRVPLDVYQTSGRARFWSNLLVSLATVRVSGDTSSTDVAWGLRAPLYDAGDPLAKPEYTRRLGAVLGACAPEAPPNIVPRNTLPASATPAQIDSARAAVKAWRSEHRATLDSLDAHDAACLERAAEKLGKEAANSLWNAPRLLVAYAGSMRLKESRLSDRTVTAHRVWAVGAIPLSGIAGPMPFARDAQLIGYADFTHHYAIDTVAAFSAVDYGGRLNYGSAAFNLFYELLGATRSSPQAGQKRSQVGWSFGVEFLATDGVWISTGIGKRAEELLKPDRTVLIANIRWGISQKSFLGPTASP